MRARGLRLLGWAVHVAFFAAWWQVALLMDRQMHDVQPAPATTPPGAAAGPLARDGAAASPGRMRADGAPVAGPPGSSGQLGQPDGAGAPQLGMRAS